MSRLRARWRHLLLAGLLAGLLLSPEASAPPGWAAAVAIGVVALGALASRSGDGLPAAAWLVALLGFAVLAGVGAGAARIAAIDAGAASAAPGQLVRVEGHVAAVPRRDRGEVRVPLSTAEGRLLAVAPEPVPQLPVGSRVRARGELAEPAPWREAWLRRQGIALELRAERLRPEPGGRGGLAGALDRARIRAEIAVGAGMGEGEAALARGFVLGQDDLIDGRTREEFKRSGLAHLLAVSGQNVMLLAILAGALLALTGVGLRLRLLILLVLIALYVPLAGAGPSIQRAGVMGAAGVAATLLGRPADRVYVTLLAAVLTLGLNPLAAGDVGWQLSFAAVIGIMLWAAPIREALLRRAPSRVPTRLARPLAEGAALTVSATVATAPLMAHHFDAFSIAALPANLLVLAAVAPVMWLGMLAAMLGQLPGVAVEPVGAVAGPLIGYVARVAERLAEPGWALVEIELASPAAVGLLYAGMLGAASAALAAARRRGGLRPPRGTFRGLAALALTAALVPLVLPARPALPPVPAGALRITSIDVGQGDAILLETPRGDPVLVDGGPPGAGLLKALRSRGVERLRAVALSHDQLDHAGGLAEVLEAIPTRMLLRSRPAPGLEALARAAGARDLELAAGDRLRLGRLRLDVLWPQPASTPAADPNDDALVLRARLGGYAALLTGDAEFEATGLDPGPIDLLKVPHHGSEDPGLGAVLARAQPRAALIAVGEANRHGHPTEATLATLAGQGVCTLRSDLNGDAWAELGPGGLRLGSERGAPAGCPLG